MSWFNGVFKIINLLIKHLMDLEVNAIKITNYTSPADAQIFKAIKN